MENGLPLFFLPCNNAGLFDVFDREGTGKPNAGSCFPLFMSLGNTAQFPPCGLSTAPAAAAPRSPYRHLELCGIALTQNPAAFVEIDDIFDVSDPPWEKAKGVCLKKFSKALPQKAFITKGN